MRLFISLIALFALVASAKTQAPALATMPSSVFTIRHYGAIRCSDANRDLVLEISRTMTEEWKLTQHVDGLLEDRTFGRDDVHLTVLKLISLGARSQRSEDAPDQKITDFVAIVDLQIQSQARIRASLICRKTEMN